MNLRDYERQTIRDFVETAAEEGLLSNSVLDLGAGQQPYRDIVERMGGDYVPFDAPGYPGSVTKIDTTGEAFGRLFATVLCTQVIQYQQDPLTFLTNIRARIAGAGHLVMTYPTNWPEVEEADRFRFTKAGMRTLLTDAGFQIVRHEKRGSIWDGRMELAREKRMTATGEEFVLGYGVVARA